MKNDEKKFQLAWEMLNQGKGKSALNLYESLPWTESKFNGVVRALTEMGHYTKAGKILMRGLDKYPCSSTLWVARGNLSLRIKDYPTALKCFETAIILSPEDSSTPLYGKALALEAVGERQKMVNILDSLIEQYPNDCLFVTEKAHCFLKMGYPTDALKLYRSAITLWYHSGQFHEGVALFTGICSACIDLGLNKEALEIAQNGIKALPPGHPILLYNLARAYCGMDMTEEAIATLKKGLEQFPSDKDLLDLLSEIQGDDDSPQDGTEIIFALILLALIARQRFSRK